MSIFQALSGYYIRSLENRNCILCCIACLIFASKIYGGNGDRARTRMTSLTASHSRKFNASAFYFSLAYFIPNQDQAKCKS